MINFPIAPTLNEQYTEGDRTWKCVKIAPEAIWDMVPISTSDVEAAGEAALEAATSADAASDSETAAAASAAAAAATLAGAVKTVDLSADGGANLVGFDPTITPDPETLTGALYREKTKYLTDKPYLADSTGVVEAGSKIKTAIESLQSGETLVAIGTYKITATDSVVCQVADNVTLDFTRAILDFDGMAQISIDGGGGTSSASTTLSLAASRMAEYIDVTDGTIFQEEDVIILLDNTQWFDLANTFRTSEANRVREVIGNRIYLDGPLLCNYSVSSSV